MKDLLDADQYNFLTEEQKDFVITLDEELRRFSYGSGGVVGDGYCWGRYMVIYSKGGVKGKPVAARIYIREKEIVLRLYLNRIDEHREFIENAPTFIREPFVNEHGVCKHCKNEKEGKCRFRKSYTIENRFIEKCNGYTFEFSRPDLSRLPAYIALFEEFYPAAERRRANLHRD